MNEKTINILCVAVPMVFGGITTYIKASSMFYVFGGSLILLFVLVTKVKLRNKNHLGAFVGGHGASYVMNRNEIRAGIVFLSLMVSPFVFIFLLSKYV